MASVQVSHGMDTILRLAILLTQEFIYTSIQLYVSSTHIMLHISMYICEYTRLTRIEPVSRNY